MSKSRRIKFFEVKYFGLVIGLGVFGICLLIQSFTFFSNIDLAVLDTHFSLRSQTQATYLQTGAQAQDRNPNISPDIVIVGVDSKSLAQLGRWPWSRDRHADFLNKLSRIGNQNQRERAALLDIFFIEPSDSGESDAALLDAMIENKRVFLETIVDRVPADVSNVEEYNARHQALFDKIGSIRNVTGDWQNMRTFLGFQPPLKPLARAVGGYGHASYLPDSDQTFRHNFLVARSSQVLETIKVDDLRPDTSVNSESFERLGWMDKNGVDHTVSMPLTRESIEALKSTLIENAPPTVEDSNADGDPDTEYYSVYRAQDFFIPSITLSLALSYFNKTLDDVEVVVGQYVRIPSPQQFDPSTGEWSPYRLETEPAHYDDQRQLVREAVYKTLDEIKIPINENAEMLINFMGPRSNESGSGTQTFPVRSYSGYASRPTSADPETWPQTLALGNKIVLAGAFTYGMAEDEKKTPFGLMYGVEMHANALNTILMNKFIYPLPTMIETLILLGFCLLVSFMSSRASTPFSLVVTVVLMAGYFIATTLVFESTSIYMDFSLPIFGMLLSLIGIIVYRVMTEEREKRRIKSMFGKYVSKQVVDQMVEQGAQPELGGVDKELTVLFSDIRGFTTLSESMTPQELVNHLNAYLSAMTDIILEFEGTLDKYVGDEIMCFWGAPLPQADHALLACKCALRQMEKLAELNSQWPPERRINIGIGLNSGIMTVGNMGSLGRMNYTLMGDNVNLGARLEGTNKQYGTNVIISEYTYGLVKEHVVARELDNIRVKGKNRPVLIYELIDVISGTSAPDKNSKNKLKT